MKTPKNITGGFIDAVEEALDAKMAEIGATLTKEAKNKMDQHKREAGLGDTSRIDASIAWTMRNHSGSVAQSHDGFKEPEDEIPVPDENLTVNFGMGIPSAYYIVNGAGRHSPGAKDEAADGVVFMQKMYDWAKKVGMHPHSQEFKDIVKRIRAKGTNPTNVIPNLVEVQDYVQKELNDVLKGLQLPVKKVTIPVEVKLRGK